jgi:hypothetical protein
MRLSIWHNTTGRGVMLPGWDRPYAVCSGIGGCIDPEREWKRNIEQFGHAIVIDDDRRERSWNHRIIGVGVGHDDARWAESRFGDGSMAAYYENDDKCFGGRQIAAIKEMERNR